MNIPNPKANIISTCDANWGPQDQSRPNPQDPDVDMFISGLLSGYITFLNGPLHWKAKRQPCTARSTAEAEILATDECVKHILYLSHIIKDLNLSEDLLSQPVQIYNDNMACIQWSNKKTARNIRHFQIRENATRESVHNKSINFTHRWKTKSR